eukprot:gnl/Dysnectes_brevis/2829_a3454_1297.p1 GENE.gnl/Dysnectes_brevis/2829_a3454_1297~~gnl/Dysnectes_brevis/2829_a3454_1297.p1  ORF type:complete len:686 (+),score=190.42 gnl/Dysnectes_brevis/2829_a3454_1297:67-2124(+)
MDFDLEQVEASIRKCEQFLAADIYDELSTSEATSIESGSQNGRPQLPEYTTTLEVNHLDNFQESREHTPDIQPEPVYDTKPSMALPQSPREFSPSPQIQSPPRTQETPITLTDRPAVSLPSPSPPPNPEHIAPVAATHTPQSSRPNPRTQTSNPKLNRLTRPRSARSAARIANIKRQRAEAEMQECTFKPKINKRPGHALRRQLRLEDRLFHEADRRRAERERQKALKDREVVGECTFRPKINIRSSQLASGQRPVSERVTELQRRKSDRMEHLRMTHTQGHPDMTFSPHISQTSRSLATRARRRRGEDTLPVTERLSTSGTDSRRRIAAVAKQEESLATECTFQPQISKTSRKLASQSGLFQGPFTDFLSRQQAFEERRRREKEELQRQKDSACTFQPHTDAEEFLKKRSVAAEQSPASESPGRPSHSRSSSRSLVDRLYHDDVAARESRQRQASEVVDTECTFKPALNAATHSLAQPSDLEALHTDSRAQVKREAARRKKDQEFEREHTFKPQLSSGSLRANSRYNLHDPDALTARIELDRQRKQADLTRTRKELEFKEIEQCTFTPTISRSRPRPAAANGTMVIKGMGRFMELQEMARRKDEEKRSRADRAFGRVSRSSGSHAPYTIQEPFRLSSNPSAGRRMDDLRDERESREMDECTFQPKTNEFGVRNLVNSLLRYGTE